MIFYRFRKLWYSLSSIVFIAGVVAIIGWGLPLGIDFTGGNVAEIASTQNTESLRATLHDNGIDALVQSTTKGTYLIKFATPQNNTSDASEVPPQEIMMAAIKDTSTVLSFDSVGPTVGKSLQQKAVSALVLASIAIIIYLAWAFRSVSRVVSAWSFGVIAVIALLHDAGIVTGLFAIIGHFNVAMSIDSYFITAILTIIGYSVNDTIVIFDRLREVLRSQPGLAIGDAVEVSIAQTLGRSLNTSLTVLLVLLPMLILGRGSLQSFLLALTLGVIVGTYSSIFIAAPLIATWQNYKNRPRHPRTRRQGRGVGKAARER